MANQLKFYRLSSDVMATKTVAAGAIWFNTTDGTIQVKTADGWDKYAGKLNDASWDAANDKLTITKHDGSSIELDFSDIASGSSVTAAIDAVEAKIDTVEASVGLSVDGAYVKPTESNYLGASTSVMDAISKLDSAIANVSGSVTGGLAEKVAAIEENIGTLEAKDTEHDTAIENITKAGGAIATAVADEAAIARAAEQANAAAAKAADDKAAAAQDEVDALEGVVSQLEADLNKRIDDLDLTEVKVEGQAIVAVSQADGKVSATAGDIAAAHVTVADASGLWDATTVEAVLAEMDADWKAGDQAVAATVTELGNRVTALDSVSDENKGRVKILEDKVAALASATHFLGVKAELPAEAEDGQIVIVGTKEYIYDSTRSPKWVELGDTTAEMAAITDLQDKVGSDTVANQIDAKINALNLDTTYVKADSYETDKTAFEQKHTDLQGEIDAAEDRLNTAESDIDGVQDDVANLHAGTGLADGASAPVYTNSNYLGSATTLVAADMALDAKIKEVADSVTSKNVSAEGDAYVSASAANNKVTISAVTGDVESKSGLATNQGVYDALCWVEFE